MKLKKLLVFAIASKLALIFIYSYYVSYETKFIVLMKNYKVFKQDEWIFNFNISQYTSIISVDNTKTVLIEGLVFYDHLLDWNYRKENTKCILNLNEKLYRLDAIELMQIALMNIHFFPKAFCRIKCLFNNTAYSESQILQAKVAFVDSKYLDHFNETFKYSKDLLTFQEPLYFNRSVEKKKNIVNCVHMVTNVNGKLKKLLDWIDIMHSFGYAKIRFYLYNINKTVETSLLEKAKNYEKGFIEFIKYKTSFEDLCEWRIKNLNQTPDSNLYQFMYNNCLSSVEKHFKMDDSMVYNAHERMNTNDCLHSFKYEYEFVTNLDFDEFIFPRLRETNNFDHFNFEKLEKNTLLRKKQLSKYNMYDYANNLRNRYGSKYTASMQGGHVLFLSEYGKFVDTIKSFQALSNFTWEIIKYPNLDRIVNYNMSDLDYLNKLKQVINVTDFLNKTYPREKFDKKWYSPYSSVMNMRDGKSIYVTDFTESCNQHWANNVSPNTRGVTLSLSEGFVSHIRDDILPFMTGQLYPYDFLKFDLEYYLFILSLSSS